MLDSINKDYINSKSPFAVLNFSNLLLEYLSTSLSLNQELVILCIGTDRSTGDSLGPLVGYKLSPYIPFYKQVRLLGTLDEPVHAKNLTDAIQKIDTLYPDSLILAIDASLGSMDKIGYINIKKGPLKPGLGVNKILPAVGHISITGIVNAGGMMEYMVLQNTRLSLVMNMATVISKSINRALFNIYNNRFIKDSKYI